MRVWLQGSQSSACSESFCRWTAIVAMARCLARFHDGDGGPMRGRSRWIRASRTVSSCRLARNRVSGLFGRACLTGVFLCALTVVGAPSAAIAKGMADKSASATDTNILSSISCTSPTSCIAVGNFGGVSSTGGFANFGTLADQWNGSTWSILNTPDVSMQGFNEGYSSSFDSISCPSSSSCVAVGSSGSTNFGDWGRTR